MFADILGEFIVQLRQLLFLDLMYQAVEYSFLACQLLRMVFCREPFSAR